MNSNMLLRELVSPIMSEIRYAYVGFDPIAAGGTPHIIFKSHDPAKMKFSTDTASMFFNISFRFYDSNRLPYDGVYDESRIKCILRVRGEDRQTAVYRYVINLGDPNYTQEATDWLKETIRREWS